MAQKCGGQCFTSTLPVNFESMVLWNQGLLKRAIIFRSTVGGHKASVESALGCYQSWVDQFPSLCKGRRNGIGGPGGRRSKNANKQMQHI